MKLFFLNRFAMNSYICQDYQKALRYYDRIRQLNPEEPGAVYNTGLCYLGLKQYAKAENCLLDDIQTQGENQDRLRILGDLYYRWKKRDQAHRYYQRLGEFLGHKEEWLKIRITLLEKDASAQKAFSAADKLDEALEAIAGGESDTARMLLEEGALDDPSSFQILNNLGVIALREAQDAEKAVSCFEMADHLMPLSVHKANLKKARSLL